MLVHLLLWSLGHSSLSLLNPHLFGLLHVWFLCQSSAGNKRAGIGSTHRHNQLILISASFVFPS